MNIPTYFNRESALMKLRSTFRYAAFGAVAILGLAACSDDDGGAGPGPKGFYLRIVNSAYMSADGANTTAAPVKPYRPIKIDVLIDSSETNPPSIMSMAENSVSGIAPNPTSAFQDGPGGHAAGYHASDVGVRSYVARPAGLTPVGKSFFTTGASVTACQEYLPRQYMTAGTFYTLVVAGIQPGRNAAGGWVWANCQTAAANFSYFAINSIQSVDDPFTPPTFTDASGNKVLQARFHLWNAAPFTSATGAGASVYMWLTEPGVPVTTTALDTVGGAATWLASRASIISGAAAYRGTSAYANVTAGTYRFTIATGSATVPAIILYSQDVTFSAGDVRSFILQNNFPANTDVPDPVSIGPAIFKLTNILDNKFSL